jgi:hypothetical protein
MSKSQNNGARRDRIIRQWLSKDVPLATNTYVTTEELLNGVCHIQYSICSERKVSGYFFPELLVCTYREIYTYKTNV